MNPAGPAGAAGGPPHDVPPLYTLSEVAEKTGIPLAELDRYRRRHGNRVPSIVLGETRRYPAEALAVFRDLHREDEAGTRPAVGGRRLMSLTAQRRRRDAAPPARPRETAGEVPAALPDATAANGAATNGASAHGLGEPATPPPFATPWAAPAPPAASGDGTGDARPAPGEAGEPDAVVGTDEAEEPEVVEVVARSGAEPVPPPSRPERPLFTLQQVHEHTGIPYPTLAFYAAAHADGVPAVGERNAKLYPWEAMAAFGRLHAEKTPGWTPRELAPPSSVEAWRRDDGIAGRLAQLERIQTDLADELEAILADLAHPLSGFAHYVEPELGTA